MTEHTSRHEQFLATLRRFDTDNRR